MGSQFTIFTDILSTKMKIVCVCVCVCVCYGSCKVCVCVLGGGRLVSCNQAEPHSELEVL